jgi:hypothetical protein
MRWLSINEVSDALGVTVGRVRQLSIALDVAGEPGVRKNPDGRKNWEWEESLVDEAKNAKKRKDLIPTQREKSWEDYEYLPDAGGDVELPDGTFLQRVSSKEYQLPDWEDYEHLPDMGYSVELPDGSVLGRFSSDTYQLFERELLALPKLREAVSTLTEEEKRLNQELSTLNTEYSMLDAITQERVRHLQLRIDKNQEEIDWLRIQFTKTMEQLKSTIQLMSQRNYIEASEILKDK